MTRTHRRADDAAVGLMTQPWRLPGVAYDAGMPGGGLAGRVAGPGRRRAGNDRIQGALAPAPLPRPRERSPSPDGGDPGPPGRPGLDGRIPEAV